LVGGISLDVTARKEAEAALRQGEALFRGVVQECSDGIAVTDEQGRVVIWNEAQARITGLPSAQVQGRSIVDVLFELTPRAKRDGERLDDLRRVVRAALERGEMPWLNQVVERKLERPDGTYRFVRSVMFTIETQQGFALASTTRDITAHKRVEAALREKQQLLTGVINHSPNIITLMDREGRYLLVNHSTAELLGCSEADLVGKTFAEVLPPETATLFMERLQTVLETQSALQVEDFMPAPDGERAYNTTLFPLYDDQGDIYAVGGLALDITARVQAEQEVARYAAELERSNQELEQFAYITSHDLREPLRMVKGYLDLLGRRYREELDASAQEFIDYAVDGAERMQEMIRALLRLSRVKTRGEAFAPTDVEAVLARTLNTLRRSIKDAGAEVTHDPLPTLMADGAQLTQVLQNLITNGIKFCREDEPPRVHVSAQREGDEWVFSVADNGIGIDPEQADRLFQIFQRLHTRAEYEGLGIGLVLCRRIVERHGGRIWVESAPGQGATFYFTLPDRGKSAHG
jgi:PAS domain S-box-containing protein